MLTKMMKKPRLLPFLAYLLLAAACLTPAFLFDFSAPALLSKTAAVVLCILLIAAVAALCALGWVKKMLTVRQTTVYLTCGIFCSLLFYPLSFPNENSPLLLMAACFSWLLFITAVLAQRRLLGTKQLILLIAAAGFILRLGYIAYTSYDYRQHDSYGLDSGGGHLAYMLYLFDNLQLPDFDPRNIWQFYHPPLHHAIAAAWMHVLDFFGMEITRIAENVQILTLFYSSCCMLIVCRILTELGVQKTALILSFSLIAFHPSFLILSGSMNNDMLSITFVLGAVLWAVRWYRERRMKHIVPIALCIGLGMMTKLSAGLVAPAVGLLFLICLIVNFKKEWLHLIAQYFVFALICLPLGLWWSIRCLVRFDLPFGYVPLLSFEDAQYIGFHSVWERLFDFQMNDVFIAQGEEHGGFFEFNPFLALLKSSMFGEYRLDEYCPAHSELITFFSTLLFLVNAAVALLAVYAMVMVIFRRKNTLGWQMKVFWLVLYFTIFGSYIRFAFSFPHTCSMDARYAVVLFVIGAVFLGVYLQRRQGKVQTAVSRILTALVPAFSLLSGIIYTLLGSR